jgi:hypothetical protein
MINFYRDMWPYHAHMLTPLTALTKLSNKKFAQHWNAECDRAFAKVKAMICHEVLLTYPTPNLAYDIETDASDKQLDAVIYQENKPIAFFSHKLTSAQTRYPTIDKEFRSLLWGSYICIFMDHKNLIYQNIKSQCILNWRMIIEEFSPEVHYKPGVENIVADTLKVAIRFSLQRKSRMRRKIIIWMLVQNTIPEEQEDTFNECLLFCPDMLDVFTLAF